MVFLKIFENHLKIILTFILNGDFLKQCCSYKRISKLMPIFLFLIISALSFY